MRTRPPAQQPAMEMFVVRIGHAERDATIQALTEHHVQGRLNLEDLDRRQAAAMEAVTQAELAALIADLPAIDTTTDSIPRRTSRKPARARESGRSPWRWLAPPAVVGTSAIYFANVHSYGGEVLATGLVCGGLGIASQWWASRRSGDAKRR